ncbi:MAG: hypothetical protein IT428_01910 [Planctomycetaceae bacterium]|nr:hypothetical protein [Planctomycetaceae bacterium]
MTLLRGSGCLTVGAYHDVGLTAALSIQREYGRDVFAFSEEASPDVISLAAVHDIDELKQLLKLR